MQKSPRVVDDDVGVVVDDFGVTRMVASVGVPFTQAVGFTDEFHCILVLPKDVQNAVFLRLSVLPAEIDLVHRYAP